MSIKVMTGRDSGLCKLHKYVVHNFLLFRPTFCAVNTRIYKLAKLLGPI